MISISDPFLNAAHISHSAQGFPFFGCKQFIAFANILAVEVFPVPRGQVKR